MAQQGKRARLFAQVEASNEDESTDEKGSLMRERECNFQQVKKKGKKRRYIFFLRKSVRRRRRKRKKREEREAHTQKNERENLMLFKA